MNSSISRRFLLKTLAGVPLAATFGLAISPIVRFFRPTIGPLNLFQPSDQPRAAIESTFAQTDFPEPWTCIPFTFQQSYVEYNPEGHQVRKIPGFILKLPAGDIVAYSRICPHLGCIFNFVKNPDDCAKGYNYRPSGPVFACPCHLSVFDIAQGGKVVSGPAPRPPRRFDLKTDGTKIA